MTNLGRLHDREFGAFDENAIVCRGSNLRDFGANVLALAIAISPYEQYLAASCFLLNVLSDNLAILA